MHSAPDRRLPTVTAAQRGLSGNAAGVIQTYLTLTGITDISTINALSEFVTGLINDGLWDKIDVMYPFIGGNVTAHSINLKNPGTYTITGWTGSVVHNSNGVTGTDSLNASFTVPFSHASQNANDFSFGTLGRFPASTGSTSSFYSLFSAGVTNIAIDVRSTPIGSFVRLLGGAFTSNALAGYSANGSTRFIGISSINASTAYSFISQFTQVSTISKGSTASGTSISVSLSSTTFPAAVFTYSFWYTGKQLTEAEMNNLNIRVQILNQTLDTIQTSTRANNYYINPSYNKVTNAFISSVGLANLTTNEINALEYLVNALQAGTNLWGVLGTIQPYVGNAIGVKVKEFRNASSLGVYSAPATGINSVALGVDPASTSSTMTPGTSFGISGTLGVYINEDIISTGADLSHTNNRVYFSARYTSTTVYLHVNGTSGTSVIQPTNTNAIGHYTITNVSGVVGSQFILYKNAVSLGSGTTIASGTTGTQTVYGFPSNGIPSSLRSQGIFYSSSAVLTPTQITELNTIIQQYVTLLNRA
jgi:hypothetical protein